MSKPTVHPVRRITAAADAGWDVSADVVVVGFGAAGASAALEASGHGSDVLLIDRLLGGGDTAYSGGAFYAGGQSDEQRAAGFDDTVEDMYSYLRLEVDGAVSDSTVRRFCEQSLDQLAWLEDHGVRFGHGFWPEKATLPPDGYHLFYSGSEQQAPFNGVANPAPRAHQVEGPGLSAGRELFRSLEAAVRRSTIEVRLQTVAQRLVVDTAGRVVGIDGVSVANPLAATLHRLVAVGTRRIPAAISVGPHLPLLFGALRALERRFARRSVRIRARHGVILATGGYTWNRELIDRYAPHTRRLMPIGLDSDGSGLLLGQGVGAATRYLETPGIFRMFVPPQAFGRGALVGRDGRRLTNEMYYHGRVGRAIHELSSGAAYLILDQALVEEARREFPRLHFIAKFPAQAGLLRAKKATSVEALANQLNMPAENLKQSLDDVATAAAGGGDPFGRAKEKSAALNSRPLYAIDVSLARGPIPATTFSLGGLVLDEETGAVLDTDGRAIAGLFAAGRVAVGVCSNSYISGLSLTDCVFSGRRAGVAVSQAISSGSA